jgi:hypothetical protein
MDQLTSEQLHQDRGPVSRAVALSFFVVAILLSASRFYVRIKTAQFGLDDVLLLLGVILAITFITFFMLEVASGLGQHTILLNMDRSRDIFLYGEIVGVTYAWTMVFTKRKKTFSVGLSRSDVSHCTNGHKLLYYQVFTVYVSV